MNGFTLIELLLVVVIIGIVAAFVLVKFGDVKDETYFAAMKNDLRNLATDQEVYFDNNGQYRQPLSGVPTSESIELLYADRGANVPSPNPNNEGYVVLASHDQTDVDCAINRTDTPVGASGDYVEADDPEEVFLVIVEDIQVGALVCDDGNF